MQQRSIFHCDCNSFYASVELLHRPQLRDKPVAVAGSESNRHGIILAKNEAAKKFGIQTAETVWQAKRKCPQLVLLPPHHQEYRRMSNIVNKIYAQYTDRVEPFGIDESWLDMTGSWQLFGETPREVADQIRKRVKEETGLSISVGVSFNKVFAKLGSDYRKPDATTEITLQGFKEIVWPLPVDAMLFVGKKVAETLAELGIRTIGQLAQADEELLHRVLGKHGRQLYIYANGLDDAPVAKIGESENVKSVGNGLTFKRDLVGYHDIRTGIGALADEVAVRLRRKKLYATSLQVQIKTPELKSISRQKALPYATHLAKDLTKAAMELIEENWDMAAPIRMLTVTAQNLSDIPFALQTTLYEKEEAGIDPKREKLEKSMDLIRKKYGKNAIVEAGILRNDIGLAKGARPDEETITEIDGTEE